MKIAFLEINATTAFGGVQTGVWNFANEFAREGHDVTVIGGEGNIRPLSYASVKILTFPFTPRKRFPDLGISFPFHKFAERFSFALRAGVRAAIVKGGFDWVILHKPLDFFWPWIPGVPRSTKFALMSGGTDFMPFDKVLSRRIKVMFGCSNFNAWQLLDHFGRQARVAYYGVDTEKFAPRLPHNNVKLARAREQGEVIFGFAGRMVGWKGIRVAIQALALEPLRGLPVRLALAGDGPDRKDLEEFSKRAGVESQVDFLGPLAHDAVASFYSSCDVGVFPSVSDEAFGITVAEAMSCGIPVIGSHIGGMPEVIGNEEGCGFLVPPANAMALATSMRDLALSRPRRLTLGANARARIQGNYTWRKAGRSFLENLLEIDGAASLGKVPAVRSAGLAQLLVG